MDDKIRRENKDEFGLQYELNNTIAYQEINNTDSANLNKITLLHTRENNNKKHLYPESICDLENFDVKSKDTCEVIEDILEEKIEVKENKSHSKINPKMLIKEYIGHISEAHHYILDNEFILKGYRINFHSCKKISKSLCMCHNETINVWTHILGSAMTITLIFMTIFNIGPINLNKTINTKENRTFPNQTISLTLIDSMLQERPTSYFDQNFFKNNTDLIKFQNKQENSGLKFINKIDFNDKYPNFKVDKNNENRNWSLQTLEKINDILEIKELIIYYKDNPLLLDDDLDIADYFSVLRLKELNSIFIKNINRVIAKLNELLQLKEDNEKKNEKLFFLGNFLLEVI